MRPWRDAVRQVCAARAEAESRAQWNLPPNSPSPLGGDTLAGAGGRGEGSAPLPYNYRLEHVRAVVTLAGRLAHALGADEDVVEAAAWLHDIAKGTPQNGEDDHGRAAARQAVGILADTDFPPAKIPAVCEAIAKHVGLTREPGAPPIEPLEAAILWDADKLSKLGYTAVLHFARLGLLYPDGRTTADAIQSNRDWFPMNRAIAASLNTPLAQEMGAERAARFEAFWEGLAREWAGEE